MNNFTLESETNYRDIEETNEFLVEINYAPSREMYKAVSNSVTTEFKNNTLAEQKVMLTNKLQIFNTIKFIEDFDTRFYMKNDFTLILHDLKKIYQENSMENMFDFISINKKHVCEINKNISLMILHFKHMRIYDKIYEGINALITPTHNITSI